MRRRGCTIIKWPALLLKTLKQLNFDLASLNIGQIGEILSCFTLTKWLAMYKTNAAGKSFFELTFEN